MSKIVIKETKKGALIKTSKMCPDKFVHLLSTALVSAVNEFDAAKDKEDFLRIMGLYYDNAK